MTAAQNNTQPIKDALGKSKDILILLGQNAQADAIAAGLGLYESLKGMNKGVFIASPSRIDANMIPLKATSEITDKIGNRNLVISLKVESRESIDKVSYNLDEESKVFNLVISPKKGNPPLKANDIDYSYAGVQADMVFVLGANRLEDLGHFYQNEQKLFSEATTVSVSTNPMVKYAMHNYVNANAGSVSELMSVFLKEIGVKMNAAVAEDLLFGVDAATHYLQSPRVSASTFEIVAELMRAGGKRKQAPQPTNGNGGQPNRPGRVSRGRGGNGQNGNVPEEWLTPKIYSGSQKKN